MPEFYLNIFFKLSSYLTENVLHTDYIDYPVKAVPEKQFLLTVRILQNT
jgi:hypothetical protein